MLQGNMRIPGTAGRRPPRLGGILAASSAGATSEPAGGTVTPPPMGLPSFALMPMSALSAVASYAAAHSKRNAKISTGTMTHATLP